jgi:hypothetical protein
MLELRVHFGDKSINRILGEDEVKEKGKKKIKKGK